MNRLEQYQQALSALFNNPHIDLGDFVYQVREREGQGWEGSAVKAWSDAVVAGSRLLREDGLLK